MDAFLLCQKASRGELGISRIADNINNAAGVPYVQDVSEFAYNNLGSGDLNGLYVWRYGQPGGTDELKRVVSVDKTLHRIVVDGPAYVETTDFNYILIGINPYKVLAAMQNGHSQMTTRQDLALTIGGMDLDMEWDNEDYWTGANGSLASTSNMTLTKEVASAANKITGTRVLRLSATVPAAAYVRGPAIRAVPKTKLNVSACLRVSSGGPFSVQLCDLSGVAFGDYVSYAGAEFAYLELRNIEIPADTHYWRLSISTPGAGLAYLDSVSARATDQTRFDLPSYVDEAFKLPLIHRMRFRGADVTTGLHASSHVHAATSREYVGDMVLGTHYQVEAFGLQAHPAVLSFETGVDLGDDLFYLVTHRSRTDAEDFIDLTDSTSAGRGELLAYLMYEVCDLLLHETKDAYWQTQRDDYARRKGQEVKPRAEVPYQPERVTILGAV